MVKAKKSSREFLRGGRSSFTTRIKVKDEKQVKLDRKTMHLLHILKRVGGNISAERLSEILNDMPARTIRYRLAKLRKSGLLGTLFMQTHEVKFGLGDAIIIMDQGSKKRPIPDSLFSAFPTIYFVSPTFGKYSGYLVYTSYPFGDFSYIEKMIATFIESGLVEDYYVLNNIDIVSIEANLSQLDGGNDWKWDWEEWLIISKEQAESQEKIILDFDLNPEHESCDGKDIEILSHAKENAELTHKEIGELIGLTEQQVGKRMRALLDLGIIKGYRWLFRELEDTLYIFCAFELYEPNDPVLAYFVNLPFPKEIHAETQLKHLIRMKMSSLDFIGFLHGYSRFRHLLKESFIQTAHDLHYVAEVQEIFGLFDPETCEWNMPIEKYIEDFKHRLDA